MCTENMFIILYKLQKYLFHLRKNHGGANNASNLQIYFANIYIQFLLNKIS